MIKPTKETEDRGIMRFPLLMCPLRGGMCGAIGTLKRELLMLFVLFFNRTMLPNGRRIEAQLRRLIMRGCKLSPVCILSPRTVESYRTSSSLLCYLRISNIMVFNPHQTITRGFGDGVHGWVDPRRCGVGVPRTLSIYYYSFEVEVLSIVHNL